MLRSWLRLLYVPYPEKSWRKTRVWFTYLHLALKSPKRERLIDSFVPESVSPNDTWKSFNCWLRFQLKYVAPRFWAISPVILSCSGGYSSVLWDKVCRGQNVSIPLSLDLERIALSYSLQFEGFSKRNFYNWLLGTNILWQHIVRNLQIHELRFDTVVEIGPGF